MVNFGAPFREFYRSSDPSWSSKMLRGIVTVLISLVLSPILVGIAGWFIVSGYGLRFLRNVQNGDVHPLPEWGQNMEDLGRGFRLFIVILIWNVPSIAIGLLQAFGFLQLGLASTLSSLYGLFVALVTPGIYIAMAQEDSPISAGFQFNQIIGWTIAHLGQVFLVVLIAIVVGMMLMVASSLGVIALGIGLLFTVPLAIFVSTLYNSHLIGQLARGHDPEPTA